MLKELRNQLKFRFSETATKIWKKISHFFWLSKQVGDAQWWVYSGLLHTDCLSTSILSLDFSFQLKAEQINKMTTIFTQTWLFCLKKVNLLSLEQQLFLFHLGSKRGKNGIGPQPIIVRCFPISWPSHNVLTLLPILSFLT